MFDKEWQTKTAELPAKKKVFIKPLMTKKKKDDINRRCFSCGPEA